MPDIGIAVLAVVMLFALVLSGVHIAFALLSTSFIAMALIGGVSLAMSLLASSAYHAINDYVFAQIPLFILMGTFMTQSRAARGLYTFLNYLLQRLRGGLGVATVFANAVFAAVTGTSVASAAVFTKIAMPEMYRYGYSKRLALGAVAGSSVLGMLIPPSVLMIVYGLLTQVSIGDLFIAGVVPGILLALIYAAGIIILGYVRPQAVGLSPTGELVGSGRKNEVGGPELGSGGRARDAEGSREVSATNGEADAVLALEEGTDEAPTTLGRAVAESLPVIGLVVLVIGGIWGGWFTPTEAGGIGALGAFLIGKFIGMTWRGVVTAFRQTAITTGAIMILLIAAQMYSRMLASSGLVGEFGSFIAGMELSALAIIVIFLLVIVVMGTVLDSTSIILLAIPVMFPPLMLLDVDPLWFGIVLIVAVELGLLTPPFGMIPFTMSAVVGEELAVEDIFVGALPFLGAMVLLIVLMMVFPGLITWLPSLM